MLKPNARSLLIALLLLALLLRQGVAVILLGLLGLALLVALLTSRWALKRIEYSRSLSTDRAFVGDEVVLTLRVANRKLLGLPFLKIDDLVPESLGYIDQKLMPTSQVNARLLRRWTALRPYEAVSWQINVRCLRRGLYTFGPAQIEVADVFGLQERELELPLRTRLLVYPDLLPIPALTLRAQHPLGETRAPRMLLTDPTRTIGVRDYRRDDPLKAIHWGATARRGELQTRIYEPTTSLDVAIIANLDTFEHYWQGIRPDLIERVISAAAAVAMQAAAGRIGFGMYANGAAGDSGELVRIAPGRSPGQAEIVMQALAGMTAHAVMPFPQLLRRLGPSIPWGATIVVVGVMGGEALEIGLLRLRGRGRRVVWLYVGDDAPPHVPGIEVVAVPQASAWAERRNNNVTSRAV